MTDPIRQLVAADTNAQLEAVMLDVLERLVAAIPSSLASGRREAVQGLADLAKAHERKLAQWNLTAGQFRSENLIRAEREFRQAHADLTAWLETPEGDDDGDEWKKGVADS